MEREKERRREGQPLVPFSFLSFPNGWCSCTASTQKKQSPESLPDWLLFCQFDIIQHFKASIN